MLSYLFIWGDPFLQGCMEAVVLLTGVCEACERRQRILQFRQTLWSLCRVLRPKIGQGASKHSKGDKCMVFSLEDMLSVCLCVLACICVLVHRGASVFPRTFLLAVCKRRLPGVTDLSGCRCGTPALLVRWSMDTCLSFVLNSRWCVPDSSETLRTERRVFKALVCLLRSFTFFCSCT